MSSFEPLQGEGGDGIVAAKFEANWVWTRVLVSLYGALHE